MQQNHVFIISEGEGLEITRLFVLDSAGFLPNAFWEVSWTDPITPLMKIQAFIS